MFCYFLLKKKKILFKKIQAFKIKLKHSENLKIMSVSDSSNSFLSCFGSFFAKDIKKYPPQFLNGFPFSSLILPPKFFRPDLQWPD